MQRQRLILTLILCVVALPTPTAYAQACDTQSDEVWWSQASNDFDLGNYDAALAGYECMIETDGELVSEGYEGRGLVYSEMGNLDAALADLNIAVTDPTNDSAYYTRGDVFFDRGDYELAIADYTEAIANGFTWAYVYNNRGVAYGRLDDNERALQDFQTAINLDPDDGLAYSNLGATYFFLGDIEATRENYALAIDKTRGLERAYAFANFAELAYMDGDYTSATQNYGSAIEADPDYLNAYLYRSMVYRAIQSPNEYADYLRYIQGNQAEIIDLPEDRGTFVDEPLEMFDGAVYRASFFLSSGQYFTAVAETAEDTTVDPLMLLLGPSGSPIVGDDDSGANRNAVINRFSIVQDGIYTLLVTHSTGDSDGTINLTTSVRNDTYQRAITTQLEIGERAKIFAISNDGPGIVNLREYPSTAFDALAQLESGTEVTLINGPYKDADFVWWQVETDDGLTGWVVEHIGGVQILSPAIAIGRTVIIDTAELNFRTEPSVNAELERSLFREAQVMFTVVDGPVEADGLIWWQLRSDGESPFTAWAVERVGNNRALAVVLDT